MTKNRSPAARWTNQHGQKLGHATEEIAQAHADELNARDGQVSIWEPYPCRWGSDYRRGQTAPKHWHVGRRGASR